MLRSASNIQVIIYQTPRMGGLPSPFRTGILLLLIPVFALTLAPVHGEDFQYFESTIRPLLIERCYECHSAEYKIKGGLRLDTKQGWQQGGDSGPAIIPGAPNDSLLIKAIRHENPDLEMPPKGKLPEKEIDLLVKWIQSGAPDPRTDAIAVNKSPGMTIEEGRQFWAFRQPQQLPIPVVKNRSWPRSDVDRLILAKLEEKRIKPVGDAAPQDLLRRIYFDLIGLPPTPQEIEVFNELPSITRVAETVDRLLASPRFGEKWGRHWLDVARYAESTGGGRSAILANAWRYRNYVIDAFNNDKPYDQFVREQIAGDLLHDDSGKQKTEHLIATGFLGLGTKNLDLQDKEELLMNTVDEQIDTVGRALLGMTLGCARCHDHKFDPIPAHDYYALAGIFRSTRSLVRDNVSKVFEQPLPDDSIAAQENGKRLDEIATLKAQVKALRETEQTDPTKQQITKIEASIKELEAKAAPIAKAICVIDEEQPGDHYLCIRGNVHQHGPKVQRGFLQVTMGSAEPPRIPVGESGRRQLADWLASTNNPLTARVYVNRVWQRLFGTGLVRSTDNFGVQGEKPAHPELLDHLAIRFMAEGWSTKKLIRHLVLSRVYQLSTETDNACRKVDPENQLRWRMPRRQLDAEALRDAILLVSGRLEFRRVESLLPEDLQNDTALRKMRTDVNTLLNPPLRSVYIPIFREEGMNDLLEVFDFANPSFTVTERNVSTLPTQALYLMNSPFVMEEARKTAETLLQVATQSERDILREIYLKILGRFPSSQEMTLALQFLRSPDTNTADTVQRWALLVHTLFASVDFRYLN